MGGIATISKAYFSWPHVILGNGMQELHHSHVYSNNMVHHPDVTSHSKLEYKFKFHNDIK
jgi:hypothetical protein